MKRVVLSILLLLMVPSVVKAEDLLEKPAAKAAIADAATTAVFMSKGIKEANPIIGQSQGMNLVMLGAKLGLTAAIQELPERHRVPMNKFATGVWGGSAVNNILIIAGASSGVAILAGLASGVYMYVNTDGR